LAVFSFARYFVTTEKYSILIRRMRSEIGFREHAHTADWELEVWAPDLPALLEQAASGLYTISGVKLKPGGDQIHKITLHSADAESLLVQFLSELLWFEQDQNLAFDYISVTVDDDYNLNANLEGSSIIKMDKEIKAVTYHNLAVRASDTGLSVNIVFDV
jgi:protein archease